MRIEYRWEAIQETNDEMDEAKLSGTKYIPNVLPNGDTKRRCRQEADNCCLSLPGNGRIPRGRRQRSYLNYTLNLKQHIPFPIP